jgi:hypothetical protein
VVFCLRTGYKEVDWALDHRGYNVKVTSGAEFAAVDMGGSDPARDVAPENESKSVAKMKEDGRRGRISD